MVGLLTRVHTPGLRVLARQGGGEEAEYHVADREANAESGKGCGI